MHFCRWTGHPSGSSIRQGRTGWFAMYGILKQWVFFASRVNEISRYPRYPMFTFLLLWSISPTRRGDLARWFFPVEMSVRIGIWLSFPSSSLPQKLKASCENQLKPKEKTLSTEIAVQTTKTEEQSANLPKSILKTKATVATKTPMAGPLIDVAPVLAESSTPDSDTPSKKATTAFSLHDIQKQRAQSLLDALGSTSSSMEI